jgi:hypothetical protein
MTPRDPFDRLVEAVSERGEIDWDESERTSETAEDQELVRNLKSLRAIADYGAPLPKFESVRPAGADDASGLRPELPGKTWAHLTILEKVGEGVYGEVHRAWDPRLNVDVALKLVPSEFAPNDEALQEARLLARVNHENVARVFGVDRAAGWVGVWTEFVDGTTLRDVAREEAPLPEARLRSIARSLLAAVGAIHDAKIVHRDLKPENVLVDKSGRIVVTDFGCGSFRTGVDLANRSRFAGTPRFLAPELFEKGLPTPGTDCYALGVILYLLATSRYPVDAADVGELKAAHREGRRNALVQARRDLSPAFAATVDRSLDPDPAKRYRSAREWLADLDATEASPIEPARSPTVAEATASAPKSGPWLTLVAVAIAAVIAFVAIQGRVAAPLAFDASLWLAHEGEGWNQWPISANGEGATDLAVRVGDRLMMSFEAPEASFVYVVNWDDAGRAYLLFPMRESTLRNPLPGGRTHRLPGLVNGEPFAWEVSSGSDSEHFAVIASRVRLAEFEETLGGLAEVDVDDGELPRSVFAGVLRGVGKASATDAPPGTERPEAFVEELQRRLAEDGKLRGRVALRVFSVAHAE